MVFTGQRGRGYKGCFWPHAKNKKNGHISIKWVPYESKTTIFFDFVHLTYFLGGKCQKCRKTADFWNFYININQFVTENPN